MALAIVTQPYQKTVERVLRNQVLTSYAFYIFKVVSMADLDYLGALV